MADTNIQLEIIEGTEVPRKEGDEYPEIPWSNPTVTPASLRKMKIVLKRHPPKKRGCYYRYTGGNTKWDDGEEISNGDFEFDLSLGENTAPKDIEIVLIGSVGWRITNIHGVNSGGPLTWTIDSSGRKVDMQDDTSNPNQMHGHFAIVVSKGDTEIYCDPNWENR